MNIEELKVAPKEDVLNYIRHKLAFSSELLIDARHIDKDALSKEHRRFDMSGYESKTGECTIKNLSIINTFAELGIYDYTEYLFVDFYKGHGTLYYKDFFEYGNKEIDLGGLGTTEIIYKIFLATILSNKSKRRRS